jgi:hypothetical protein
MEHAIHVAGGHFIRRVGPTSSQKVLKRVKAAHRNASDYDVDLDEDQPDAEGGVDSGEDSDDNQFDTGDTVGKALALVTQVGCWKLCFRVGLMLCPQI